MARQNRRTTRKNQGVKAKGVSEKKSLKKSVNKEIKTDKLNKNVDRNIKKESVDKPIDNVEETIITELNQRVRVLNDIDTINGTLYKDQVVKVESVGDGLKDLRVADDMGRIWFVNLTDVSTKL